MKDSSANVEEDLGPMDEHKNVIMHLLSQLKLGMDLTKVRSLVYAESSF